eukprot:TRINITY_DN9415_c0_g3_i2.p1 TRINITY_DN9415_c0_g3~~TRINITY_DN9415_c0_g3_i2.p1  ORF type:complete len:120 (-),score=33.60 TRINITY_DN9415_c0_g3_i2:38-397(-)
MEEQFKLKKRPAYHTKGAKNEIFFTRQKPRIIYYNRVKELIGENCTEVKVKAVGAAIKGAVDLALRIEREFADVQLNVETGTITLIDDFVDRYDNEVDGKSKTRLNSTICITINIKPLT